MKPEDITEEGWYYDPANDEFCKVEMDRPVYRDWVGHGKPFKVTYGEPQLYCDGIASCEDWPEDLRGPIKIPEE